MRFGSLLLCSDDVFPALINSLRSLILEMFWQLTGGGGGSCWRVGGGWDCGWGKLVVGWGVGWGLVGVGGGGEPVICLLVFDFFVWKCVMIYCVWCSFCILQGVKHQVTYSLWWPLWLLFKSVLLSFFIFFRVRFLLSWCFCWLSLFLFFCIPGFGHIMGRCIVFRYGWTN